MTARIFEAYASLAVESSIDQLLATIPGERWDEESGLNDHHYIVPGAGGLGEIMNNSFV